MSNSFDYEQFKANAIEQLKAGVPLSGKDGVLAPLLENLLNSALEGEMDSHLENGEREFGNRRNGHMSKQVQTSMGEVTINHRATGTALSILKLYANARRSLRTHLRTES